MLKKIIITNLFLLLLNFTTSIAKDLSCETFSGEWNGNKKGAGYKGDLKIVFDDGCKYDIFKKNGKILTPGKIKIKKGTKVTYTNKAAEELEESFINPINSTTSSKSRSSSSKFVKNLVILPLLRPIKSANVAGLSNLFS